LPIAFAFANPNITGVFQGMKSAWLLVILLIFFLAREATVRQLAVAGGMPQGDTGLMPPLDGSSSAEVSMPAVSQPTLWAGRPAFADLQGGPPAIAPPLPWVDPTKVDGSFSQKFNDHWGDISSRLEVHDFEGGADRLPVVTKKCQTEEAVRMTVAGPVYVFGQLGTNCDSLDSQELKISSRTGLGWEVLPWSLFEVQVRGGHCVSCDDPNRPERAREQSDLFLEMQCRCPLPGKLSLEYQSTATPALTVTERDRIDQDLRLAFPLGGLGQFRVGAKHSWENASATRPWTEGMQVYVGLDLKH
jgi:hypothetical protein